MSQVGLQVQDDLALLDLMLRDASDARPPYKPTNYWAAYEEPIEKEMRANGLKDFRRRTTSVLQSLGAVDPWFSVGGGTCA